MEEWKEYKLGELTTMKNGKKRPKNVGLYPVYGGNGVMDYADNYNAENVIIVGRVGAYCGNVFKCDNKCWVSDNAISVFPNDTINKDYLYYLMCRLDLHHHHIGAAQPLMTQDIIGNFEVKVPTFYTQQKIANILSSLDDKIEVNRRINEQLEELAQALFKSWFVDFEPFKDGEFVESELGMIPEGWKVGKLGDVANISSGKRPPMKQSVMTEAINIPLIGASSVMGFTNDILYNKPIIVIGRVGTHGIVQRFNTPCWPSDNTLVIESTNYEYVYQILKTIDYKGLNRGSTQPLITQTDVKNQVILIPNENVLYDYNEIVSRIMDKSNNNLSEITHLANLRDTLLPKLMSGEIDVNNNVIQ